MPVSRKLTALGWGLSVLVAGSIGWAGARQALAPAEVPVRSAPKAYVAVSEGTAGHSLDLVARATWKVAQKVPNGASGVVTRRHVVPGQQVKTGQVLYSVDLKPVVALPGALPAFRPLQRGTSGPDVKQLQQALTSLGYRPGNTSGRFTAATAAAVKAWQKKVGLAQTGVLAPESVVFFPQLPARVRLSEELAVGARASAGTGTIEILGSEPDFALVLSQGQQSLVPMDALVSVSSPSGRAWQARMGRVTASGEETLVSLTGIHRRSVCGDECDAITSDAEQSVLSAKVVIVPEARGATLPSGAVRTGPDGKREVVTESGTSKPVTVVAEANGIAVVQGVEVGERVELFAQAQS